MFRCRLRFLQCLAVHAEGACRKNEKPDARIRLHRISWWLLRECTWNYRQIQIPQSDTHNDKSGHTGSSNRKVHILRNQFIAWTSVWERWQNNQAARPRQSRNGNNIRGINPAIQWVEQRGSRRTLDTARCGGIDVWFSVCASGRQNRGLNICNLWKLHYVFDTDFGGVNRGLVFRAKRARSSPPAKSGMDPAILLFSNGYGFKALFLLLES